MECPHLKTQFKVNPRLRQYHKCSLSMLSSTLKTIARKSKKELYDIVKKTFGKTETNEEMQNAFLCLTDYTKLIFIGVTTCPVQFVVPQTDFINKVSYFK